MSTMDFTVRPATSAQWPALEDLFGRSGASNGCWCMYWRIGPRAELAWLARARYLGPVDDLPVWSVPCLGEPDPGITR
jgi:hypothetical protein